MATLRRIREAPKARPWQWLAARAASERDGPHPSEQRTRPVPRRVL